MTSVKIDHSVHLQGIETCWREWWLKCSSLHRIAAQKSAEWEFSSPLLLAQCALAALLPPACMRCVWFAWDANRQGQTSLCPTFSFFPWADSVPLWQLCKCRVTLWANEQRKKLLEVSVAQCDHQQSTQPLLTEILNRALQTFHSQALGVFLLNSLIKPWLLNRHAWSLPSL